MGVKSSDPVQSFLPSFLGNVRQKDLAEYQEIVCIAPLVSVVNQI